MESAVKRISGYRKHLETSPHSQSYERMLQGIAFNFQKFAKTWYDGSEHFVSWVPTPGIPDNESEGFEDGDMMVNTYDKPHIGNS